VCFMMCSWPATKRKVIFFHKMTWPVFHFRPPRNGAAGSQEEWSCIYGKFNILGFTNPVQGRGLFGF
jgi:hypothetical protein